MIDVLSLKVGQVRKLSVGDQLKVKETKTGKSNTFHFNGLMIDSLRAYLKTVNLKALDWLFPSRRRKGHHLTSEWIGDLIKALAIELGFKGRNGSHSMRKTFSASNFKNGQDPFVLMLKFRHARM